MSLFRWCCLAAMIVSAAVSVGAQNRGQWPGPLDAPNFVSRIEFDGNQLVSSQTIQALIFTRAGYPYLGKDFLGHDVIELRSTKYFTSVRLEVKDDPNRTNGKIVIFHLIERPPSQTTIPNK
jgi:outer membrane protein assembly factor BamA